MTEPKKPPEPDETLEEIANQPVTGETLELGDKQELPTGREWDAERGVDIRDQDLESLETEDVVLGERPPPSKPKP
jgi:hypothetical protein